MARPDPVWWYWLVTGVLVLAAVLALPLAVEGAAALTTAQLVHLRLVGGRLNGFAGQIRIVYLALLLFGTLPGFAVIHVLQLIGTTTLLVFGYCPLARTLALLPWNRRTPLTCAAIVTAIVAPPRRGVMWQGLGGLTGRGHGDCPALAS